VCFDKTVKKDDNEDVLKAVIGWKNGAIIG
jgi:hypothetical protein